MEDKQFFLVALYFMPYLAAVFMPNWRALGLAALGWVGFGIWAFFFRGFSEGMEGAMEATLGALIFMGAVSGLLIRALVLFLRDKEYSQSILIAVTIVGAFLLPIFYILTLYK